VMKKALYIAAILGMTYGLSACSVWHKMFG
jgi:hypothetical protein